MVKTAVLVSGGGTNLQAVIDANISGKIKNCELAAVISSNPDAYAVTRAQRAGIPSYIVDSSLFADRGGFTTALRDKLLELDIGLVVLAGFNYVIGPALIDAFKNRIVNIHPSLIPSFCGPGYYGLRVHEAVLKHGVKITGATAHFASEIADDGPIIIQKAVPIMEDDTPESLQRRVMEEAEWEILPRAISLFCEGRLEVVGRVVHVKEAAEYAE